MHLMFVPTKFQSQFQRGFWDSYRIFFTGIDKLKMIYRHEPFYTFTSYSISQLQQGARKCRIGVVIPWSLTPDISNSEELIPKIFWQLLSKTKIARVSQQSACCQECTWSPLLKTAEGSPAGSAFSRTSGSCSSDWFYPDTYALPITHDPLWRFLWVMENASRIILASPFYIQRRVELFNLVVLCVKHLCSLMGVKNEIQAKSKKVFSSFLCSILRS